MKYYLSALLSLFVIIGILLGGLWMWFGFVVLFVVVILGDALFSEDESQPKVKYPFALKVPLYLTLPVVALLLVAFAWSLGSNNDDLFNIAHILSLIFNYDFILARNVSTGFHYVGAVLGCGFIVASYGTNVGHELIHRAQNWKLVLVGRWLLSASCNADFSVEHIYGHHAFVGTKKDPATAFRGQNVYGFFIKSTALGHVSAWKIELKRLRKKKHYIFSWNNKILTGYLMSLVWCLLFFYAAAWFGVALFLAQALLAKFLLEATNYMEHYGLTRDIKTPVGPQHSWNTNKQISGIVLFSLTRHSSHHEKPKLDYWKLDPYVKAPKMPFGYLTTLLVTMIPPLWKSVIHPLLDRWEKKLN